MVEYKVVENSSKRSLDYKDGDACSVGYEFFSDTAYNIAKIWLKENGIEYADNGFRSHDLEQHDFDAHIIATCYDKSTSDRVFDAMDNLGVTTICCVAAHWVDLIYTKANPMKVTLPNTNREYYIWEVDNNQFQGTADIENLRSYISNARLIQNFNGFTSIYDVKEYVLKYFDK